MRMFERLCKLPKCDIETKSEQIFFDKKTAPVDLFDAELSQNLQFVNNAKSAKCNKTKHAYIYMTYN